LSDTGTIQHNEWTITINPVLQITQKGLSLLRISDFRQLNHRYGTLANCHRPHLSSLDFIHPSFRDNQHLFLLRSNIGA
jgi:hypothetical protein